MPLRLRSLFAALSLSCFVPALVAAAPTPENPALAGWLKPNPGWTETVVDGEPAWVRNAEVGGPQLQSFAYIGDNVVRLTYRPVAAAGAAPAELLLHARYPVALDGTPGEWHTIEARVRGPRYDDGEMKIEKALVLDVIRDGEMVGHNLIFAKQAPESEFTWENGQGPTTLRVPASAAGFAVRTFEVRRADYSNVTLPAVSGGENNRAALVDFVAVGRDQFKGLGCAECHAVEAGDPAVKTGPNQFGLFQVEPRNREILSGGEGHRFIIKADRSYLQRSVRTPAAEVAIAELGPKTGEPFLPVMPPYVPEVVSDHQIDAIGSYLATLNVPAKQGPVEWLVPETGPENYDPVDDRLQLLVDQRVRVQRGPMVGTSGRAIHVGQPNGVNFTFDPRVLGVVKIWQGGFLNMAGEWLNRGGKGLKPGYESRELDLGEVGQLIAPLNAAGLPIDFSFKDANFGDVVTRQAAMRSTVDPLDQVAAVDAAFLGYASDSRDPLAPPTFAFRVGLNHLTLRLDLAADGAVKITVGGERPTEQRLWVNPLVLTDVTVSAGEAGEGEWLVPAGSGDSVTLTGRLGLAPAAWRPVSSDFDYMTQPLVTEAGAGRLMAGYSVETYLAPKDNYGRTMLFEPLGMAVAPDGTVVVATRTAGIWRLRDGVWHLFAEGLFDSLGVQVEDEHGLVVVAGQKAELTRISDTNGDGLADRFETMSDAFSYHSNYHAYMHGPVRDPATGDYFITLNLADGGDGTYYNAGGKYMGTAGGFRGWAVRVPPGGGFEPWADGMRSPASLGFDPAGQLWYADNQGEYVGTSKIFRLQRGGFYGHPAGLIDRPGMTPDSPEIAWPAVQDTREWPAVLLPQKRLANSPGNPAWDTTGGGFGPFGGQMFIGDQTQSVLMRVTTETVAGRDQGMAIAFAQDLESGIMRPVFLPDGSLLLGETGRGWQAKGGRVASLQHLRWDGHTVPAGIANLRAVAGGFAVELTTPLPVTVTDAELTAAVQVRSWTYRDAPDYGSDELDEHDEPFTAVEVAADRRSFSLRLASTVQPVVHPQQTARVYRLRLDGAVCGGTSVGAPGWEAFYTLYGFPKTADEAIEH